MKNLEGFGDTCDHTNWKEQIVKRRKSLEESDGTMLECLEEEWREIDWGGDKRKGLLNVANNPLNILDYFLDICTFPPPEVLMVIADMYRKYIYAEGTLSMEDVFFGPPKKGVGNYAATRSVDKSKTYNLFHLARLNQKYSKLSDIDLATELKLKGLKAVENTKMFHAELNKIDKNNNKEIEDIREKYIANGFPVDFGDFASMGDEESFLRAYRRWRKSRPYLKKRDK